MPTPSNHSFSAPDTPVLQNVSGLFSENKTYMVPKWQRDYSWDADEEVRLLLDDLKTFCDDPRLPNYMLGSFITYTQQDTKLHYVVDGQQRLVTLYVLTLALRDCLQKRIKLEYPEGVIIPRGLANQLNTIENIALRTGLDGTDSIPVILEFGNASTTLDCLAHGNNTNLVLEQMSQLNIWATYEFCVRYIDDKMPTSLAVASFARAVLSGTYLTENIVDNVEQALEIFLKINIRGKELEGSDYLKNYLFRNVDPSVDFDELAEIWESMCDNLRSNNIKREKLKKPEFFLRNWALVLSGEKIGGDNAVFNFWEARFKNNPLGMSEFLTEVPVKSKHFSKIAASKLIFSSEVNHHLEGADFFKGTQYLPVLLASAKLDQYEYISKLVNHRYIFYILSQERTQEFESMIPKWAKKIGELPGEASIEAIDAATKLTSEILISNSQLESLNQKIQTYRYGVDTRKIRMILAVLSKEYQERVGYDNLSLKQILKGFKGGSGFDIDHILPQGKIHTQKNLNAVDQEKELERVTGVFNSIGNLSLVNGLQRVYRDKNPFEKNALYKQDPLIFTQVLSDDYASDDPSVGRVLEELHAQIGSTLGAWNEKSVEERGKLIARLFVETFPSVLKG